MEVLLVTVIMASGNGVLVLTGPAKMVTGGGSAAADIGALGRSDLGMAIQAAIAAEAVTVANILASFILPRP